MPRVDVWIRKNDFDKWEAIKDKPEFLHNALNVREAYLDLSPTERVIAKQALADIPKKIAEVKSDWKPCKHGADPRFCKFSKPGKSCK